MFRTKRADGIKIIWWECGGVCLCAKRLNEWRFAGR
ncbi:MAG: IS66 family insertion sequence element accessory protein TnpB [Alphaproteobacteria bacterium]|nr:IS66 family insertion sequence element accessory protein TnpB [Alphaproteobacteria bacterium]